MDSLKSFLTKQAEDAEEAISAIVLIGKPRKADPSSTLLETLGLMPAKISFFMRGDSMHTAGMLIELIEHLKQDPEFTEAWDSVLKMKEELGLTKENNQ